ncbi:adenosylcobinamide-GDP ribazoletransferase [Novosphingobium sp. CECT 9465]|uniref:adenosylcobinamide-GDP ribazoletransferase n=1 Tax=Novosphingobium sp. CECT 9465 TaxID=2829794 RepID=UPI001E590FA8|nr:adenosylcobinamide-GDP ribazoletransferase [Novosphingobium sp. CECT 9465]CAH0495244.1 Adenosylcobinamide-GDP ribazoletransferase [Novosphingobium sp. CECT 9465]
MMLAKICSAVLLPLLLAIQFLTRLPVTAAVPPLDKAQLKAGLRRSVLWFPLVGGLIGGIGALVLWGAGMLWPRVIAVVLMLIVEARLTGAFHEDAVADFCDGFGGGMTAERIREIMKDSRIGTYGALGLMLAVGLRAALLIALPAALLLPALVASAAFGRWMAVVAMVIVPPLDQTGSLAKDIGQRPGLAILGGATLLALPFVTPLAMVAPGGMLAGTGCALLFLLWFRQALMRHLGGVTGDCLGFAVYAGQLIVLLCASAQWPAP